MAKKDTDRLTVADIVKFRPRKAPLPCLTSLLFCSSGEVKSTSLEYSMLVQGGHESNMDVVLSGAVIEQMTKSKDWPKSIEAQFVEKVTEEKGKTYTERLYSATVTTEKGLVIQYSHDNCSDPMDFPDFNVVKFWNRLAVISAATARKMNIALRFVEKDPSDNGNVVACLNVEGGKVWGFSPMTGMVIPSDLDAGVGFKLGKGFEPYLKEDGFEVWQGTLESVDHIKIAYADGSYLMSSLTSQSKQYPCRMVSDMLNWEFNGVKLKWWATVADWKTMLDFLKPWMKQSNGYTKPVIRLHANGKVELMHADLRAKEPVHEPVTGPEYTFPCNSKGLTDLTAMLNPDLLRLQVEASDPRETLTLVSYGSKHVANGQNSMHHLRIMVTNDPSERIIMPYYDRAQPPTH